MRHIHIFIMAVVLLTAVPVAAQEPAEAEKQIWLPTLITETPEQGFDLAIAMARKAVKSTQPDVEVLHKLRPAYAHDPESLIQVSGVIAEYFGIIAAANDYWRE